MIEKLILDSFKKAGKDIESNKVTRQSSYISDYIYNDSREEFGEKSLRDKYNRIKNQVDVKIELKDFVKESLSHYLGYESYRDYKLDFKTSGNNGLKKKLISSKSLIISSFIVLLLVFIITLLGNIFSKNNERWMTWQEDQYIEVEFDLSKYYKSELDIYDKYLIMNFKEINNPNCNTEFFNDNGLPNKWYWKQGKGNLEIFTAPGLHPINGKTLKKITREHICKEF